MKVTVARALLGLLTVAAVTTGSFYLVTWIHQLIEQVLWTLAHLPGSQI
jgi:hypothetical protein